MRGFLMLLGFAVFGAFLSGAGMPPLVDNAAIYGTVTDQNHVPIPGAVVRVRNNMTQTTTLVRTNETGDYRVGNLRQGRYAIRAEAKDHEQLWICEVVVHPGEMVRQDLMLRATLPGRILPEPVCPDREARRR